MGETPESIPPEQSSPLFVEGSAGGEIPTEEGIRSWLLNAKLQGATYVVVVCDTYDWSDYPVSIMPGEDVHEIVADYDGKNMQKVIEVYWLGGDLEAQLELPRSFTYGPSEE